MKWVVGILRILLILITKSTPPADSQWTTTPPPTASVLAYVTDSQLTTSSAVLASVTSTVAPPAAVPDTSFRLPGAVEEETPDYCEEICEAFSGADRSCAALVPGSSTECEPIDDGATEVMVGGAGPRPASDSAASTSSPGRRGIGDDALRGRETAPSGSTGTMSRREEIRGCDGVGAALDQFPPAPKDWRRWLPSWCRHWPPYGPLGVPRNVQLQAFSEALVEHATTIAYQLTLAMVPRGTDGQSRTENPRTRLASTAVEILDRLHKFYDWMFGQLVMSEGGGDSTPEALYRFLAALDYQASFVGSDWSPTLRWTCTGPECGVLGKMFWALDRHFIWQQIFQRWAASQYNGTPGPRRHPYWWLPPLFEETPPFNVLQVSRNQVAGDSASGMETVSDSVYTIENIRGAKEPFRNVSSVAASNRSSCSIRQTAPQEQNRYKKWTFPTCELQHISTSDNETRQLMWPKRIPIVDPESGMPIEQGGDELGAATASSQKGLDGDDGTDVNPDESFCGEHEPHVVEQQGEEQDEGSDTCWGFHVVLTLQLGSQPQFLVYMKCDDRENACDLPEICTPVSSEVTVEMPRGATLPNFPHTKLSEQDMPSHRRRFTLLVPTSCKCMQLVDGS